MDTVGNGDHFGIPVIGFLGYVSALVLALMLGRNIWLNSHGGKH